MSYIILGGICILTVGFKFLRKKNKKYDSKGIVESVRKMNYLPLKTHL